MTSRPCCSAHVEILVNVVMVDIESNFPLKNLDARVEIFAALPKLVSACAFLNLKIIQYRSGTTRRKDLNLNGLTRT